MYQFTQISIKNGINEFKNGLNTRCSKCLQLTSHASAWWRNVGQPTLTLKALVHDLVSTACRFILRWMQ
jgi:hypothetical protein